MTMVSAKQALIDGERCDSKGELITEITRGRISHENHEWLASQYAKGVRFTDYVPKGIDASAAAPKPGAVTPKPGNSQSVTNEKNLAEVYIRYPEGAYSVRETVSGKVRSMREACNNCSLSLIGHMCDSPMIVSTDGRESVAVTIKGVKTSNPTKQD